MVHIKSYHENQMATYYGNDHFNTGHRELHNGRWVRIFMGNADGSNGCSYSHRRWYAESHIIGIDSQGICTSGGRAKRIRMRDAVAGEEITGAVPLSETDVKLADAHVPLPGNVRSTFVGNGHIVWTEVANDLAGSVAFVPAKGE